jgi:quercetin dioxygenase-like cupin family protein
MTETRRIMSRPLREADSVRQGRLDELPAEAVLEGVTRRRLDGTKLTLMHYSFAPDATHGLHSHVEEQVMMVVHGSVDVHLLDSTRTVATGEYCLIPPRIEHGVTAGKDGAELLVVVAPRRTTGYEIRAPAPGENVSPE